MKESKDMSYVLHELGNIGDAESGFDTEGAWRNVYVQGVKTKVYTKYFTGTLAAAAVTNVAHGVSDVTKILSVVAIARHNSGTYLGYDNQLAAGASTGWGTQYTATNVVFHGVVANVRSQPYRIRIDYYL